MDQFVEVERVDLDGLKPCKSLSGRFQQQPELLFLIMPDQLGAKAARRCLGF
jgi:hypothetical protein